MAYLFDKVGQAPLRTAGVDMICEEALSLPNLEGQIQLILPLSYVPTSSIH